MLDIKLFYFDSYTIIFISTCFAVSLLSSMLLKNIIANNSGGMDSTIEGLRGIACMMVFISHSAYTFDHMKYDTNISYSSFYSAGSMGALGVEIFFCITGYLFSNKIKNNLFDFTFFVKRIKRLAPAFLVVSTFVFAIYVIENHSRVSSLKDLSSIILQVFGFGFYGAGIEIGGVRDGTLNSIVWSLEYEWKFYAAIPFVSYMFFNRKSLIPFIAFGLCVAITDIYSGRFLWLYFFTGFAASYISNRIEINNTISTFITIILLTLITIINKPTSGVLQYLLVSFAFLFIIYARPKFISSKSLCFVGVISYSIYLIHQPVLHLTTLLMHNILEKEHINNIALTIYIIFPLTITMILSVFCYKYIEHHFYNKIGVGDYPTPIKKSISYSRTN